jgi:tetratricopeptide (TPR) repeat protein
MQKRPLKILLAVFAAILLTTGIGFAQSGADYYFEQGNTAYRNGDYELAAEWYQKILDAGYENSVVHYNLGNCYYKLDKIGLAVLHYEKARKLAPDDPEIQFNLELANLKVRDRIELPEEFVLLRWWQNTKHLFSLSGWTHLTAFCYVFTILAVIAYLFATNGALRRIIRIALISGVVVTVLCGTMLLLNILDERQKEAIILADTLNVLSAPDDNGTNVFLLHEGAKVQFAEQRGEWVKIVLPDGKSGWIKRQYLEII